MNARLSRSASTPAGHASRCPFPPISRTLLLRVGFSSSLTGGSQRHPLRDGFEPVWKDPQPTKRGIGRQRLQRQRQGERERPETERERQRERFFLTPFLFSSSSLKSLGVSSSSSVLALRLLLQQSRSAISFLRLDNTLSRCLQGLKGSQLIFTLLAALPLTTPRLSTQVVFRRFAVRRTGP